MEEKGMNMKRLALMLALVLALCLGLSAAAETLGDDTAEVEAAANDPVLATAKGGAIEVRKSEVEADYEEALAYYLNMYTQYGYQVDEYDVSFQENVANTVVESAVDLKVIEAYAKENGYEVTEEKQAGFAQQAAETLEKAKEEYRTYLQQYGLEGDELEQTIEEAIRTSGYTEEALAKQAAMTDMVEYVYSLATADVSVTEEDVKEEFDAAVAEQKASFDENADEYINTYLSDGEILYTPEGVRIVRSIYIAKEEEVATPEEATAEEATPAQAEGIENMTGLAKAEAVLAAIEGGQSFDDAMAAYNEDTSSAEEMQKGYPVSAGSTLYGEEFVNAAMALEKVGDVSPVVDTEYGYFILSYASDVASGTVDFEAIKEKKTEEVLENHKQEAYSTLVTETLTAAEIQYGDFTTLYHVYVGQEMGKEVAYGTIAEAAEILDKPEGIAVAQAAAGTTFDILGRIESGNEVYAFVAVPGTEIKGYVPANALNAVEEAEALSNDNTALVERKNVENAQPIFTIAMNDGSLIYGELYPEKAPESVGNFAELANSSFYDGLTFHRVIAGFMIQGGDPNGDGTGGPEYSIKGEFSQNGVENDLSHVRGVLSMARSQEMDSAGSQFFIMHADGDFLDGQYAAFGMVLGGLETVDVIASVPTDSNDKPRNDQIIRTIYVETHGNTYSFTKITD